MKTRVLIIIGAVGIGLTTALMLGMINSTNFAFPYGYPRISQNDLYCETAWYVTNITIDEKELVRSLRDTISKFGSHVDIPQREIIVSHNGDKIVVSVAGIWTGDENQYDELTSVVKNFVGDSKSVVDNRVACA